MLDSDNMSGLLIDVSKHLCNLKYTVWEKMLDHVDFCEYFPGGLLVGQRVQREPCLL